MARTRFSEAFQQANFTETLAGRIVLSIGCDFKSDAALGLTQEDKARMDELHKRKIDLADEILVLNVDGYVGLSTSSEITYARQHHKRVRWLNPPVTHKERLVRQQEPPPTPTSDRFPPTITSQISDLERLVQELRRRVQMITPATSLGQHANLYVMLWCTEAMLTLAPPLRQILLHMLQSRLLTMKEQH